MTRELDALRERINRSGLTQKEVGVRVAQALKTDYSRPEAVVHAFLKRKTKKTSQLIPVYHRVLDEAERGSEPAVEPRLPDSERPAFAELVVTLASCTPEQLAKISEYAQLVTGRPILSRRR